jgi:3-hydroxyisobutyrate dehydrogenase-like beta-hydroxyacid dehydrogenase
MIVTTVGLLHPGAMGATIGAACRAEVVWAGEGRSPATGRRAADAGFVDVGDLTRLVGGSDVIVSVCPPEAAVEVADRVAGFGFDGIYVDANAVSPQTARSIAARFDRFVDGGIIGPPAVGAGTTRLYLSGDGAHEVAALWEGSPLDARVIDGGAGAASTLKMAYAAWTKVSAALLLDVRALARAEGVEAALLSEWALSQPGTTERSQATAVGVGPKAWRFAGEMHEIATTFEGAGLPSGFGTAAAELYARLTTLKDAGEVDLDRVLGELLS